MKLRMKLDRTSFGLGTMDMGTRVAFGYVLFLKKNKFLHKVLILTRKFIALNKTSFFSF